MVKPTLKTIIGEEGKEYYVITKATDLRQYCNIVNGLNGYTRNLAANAILMADIDLNPGLDPTAEADQAKCRKWRPIGNFNYEKDYQGTFDGNGYVISGIYIDSLSGYAGLFGYIGATGTVKNLTMDKAFIQNTLDTGYVGCIAASNNGKIINCTGKSDIHIHEGWNAGGIVGWNNGNISNCQSYADVHNQARAGGIAGVNFNEITGCKNYGSVSGKEGKVGGLVGVLYGSLINSRNFTAGLPDCGEINDDAVYIPYDADEQVALSDNQTFGGEISW